MKFRCHNAACTRETDRIIIVSGVEGFWPVCGSCGRRTIKFLMNLYPGKALVTRGRNTR